MFYLCLENFKFIEIISKFTSMNLNAEDSACGMITPSHAKPKGGRTSQTGAPVRVSFQKAAARQPVPTHGRNNVRLSQTEGGFKKADFQLALKNTEKKSNRSYKGEQMGMCTESDRFKVYGPGICLFFEFQKSLINTFLIMSLVSLVPLVYNVLRGPVMGSKGSSLSYWIAASTVGNFDSQSTSYGSVDKYMNVIPDIVATFVFVVFYFYWLHKGEVITQEIRSEVKLKSYYTVELVDFPGNATEEDVLAFMGQFGTVLEVAPVRNYNQTIALSKKIFDCEIELKQLQLHKIEEKTSEYDQQIASLKQKIDQIYKELVLYEDDTKEETIQYYVMFTNIDDRENALKQLQQYQKKFCSCCAPETPQNYKLCGEQVIVKPCHTEPADVIWENQHITWSTRWIRVVIMYILLLAGIGVGFCLISFMNILVPSSSSSVDTSSYSSTSIQSQSNTTIVQSWCITNQMSVISAGASSSIYNYCYDYILKYYLKIAITIGIAIGICLIKFILKHFVIFLSSFKRYRTHTEQSKDMVQNLVFVYVATTVLVTLLLQAEMFGVSFKKAITFFISNNYLKENANGLAQYYDFMSDWYVNIGYQIIFNALILVVHPTFTMPIFYCLMEKVSRCRAAGEEVQAKMEKKLELPEFELESDYAEILTMVLMGLAFSGGMPAITIIVFLALLFRYFYQKFYFFRYCKVPKMFDEALDLQVSSLIPYGIIVHYAFSIWMYGNQRIFQYDSFSFAKITAQSQNSFVQSIGFLLQRLFGTWYYSIFFLLFLAAWMFKTILFNCLVKVFISGGQSHKIIPVKFQNKVESSSGTGFNNTFVSCKSLCDSYKIEHNPDYVEVLEIMKRKRKFIVKVKNIEGEQLI